MDEHSALYKSYHCPSEKIEKVHLVPRPFVVHINWPWLTVLIYGILWPAAWTAWEIHHSQLQLATTCNKFHVFGAESWRHRAFCSHFPRALRQTLVGNSRLSPCGASWGIRLKLRLGTLKPHCGGELPLREVRGMYWLCFIESSLLEAWLHHEVVPFWIWLHQCIQMPMHHCQVVKHEELVACSTAWAISDLAFRKIVTPCPPQTKARRNWLFGLSHNLLLHQILWLQVSSQLSY